LKKAASGVLAFLPCSRTESTLRASKWLRPCWTDFFEHSLQLMIVVSSGAFICRGNEIFNSPNTDAKITCSRKDRNQCLPKPFSTFPSKRLTVGHSPPPIPTDLMARGICIVIGVPITFDWFVTRRPE
jgi:hypothetical protein